MSDYRQKFFAHNGSGPYPCHFCVSMVVINWDDDKGGWAVHHVDHNKKNNAVTNLVISHSSCHSAHHALGRRSGIPHTPEARERIGQAQRGIPKTPEHVAKVAAKRRGQVHGEEARAKMRVAWARRKDTIPKDG